MPFGEARDARRHEDRARPGELLHAAGEVRALADRGVVHGEAPADRADDDLPGVEADADARRGAPALVQLSPVARERLLHAQGGVTGADGVVLERHRRAEQRHDAVAHHLVHRAVVLAHGVHHQGQRRIEDFPGLLGVAPREQLHGVLEVGKEDRDLLALAFERALVGEYVVRHRGRRRGGYGLPASRAEPVGRLVGVAAREARGDERGAAVEAETPARVDRGLALPTGHDGASGGPVHR